MGDYIKLQLLNHQFSKPILQNPLFSFEARVKDAEIISRTATYKNMKVCVNDRQTIISGSLHKFWNPNGSNSNDFPMGALRLTIIELSHLFGFSPDDAIILGLEYGVNVVPDAPTGELISRAICYDWRQPFESMQISGAGNGKEARLSNYRIKIYDKGLQYGLSEPLLRFECKTNRSFDLKDTGARTLSDLTDSEVLQHLGQELISRFESILFHEKLDETVMSHKEQLFYHDAGNPLLWKEMERWKRNDSKKKYAQLLEKHGGGSLKSNLKKQIADKWEELQKCNDFAGFSESIAEENRNVFAQLNECEPTAAKLANCNDFAGFAEGESEEKRNIFAPFNDCELTTDKLEKCNDFAGFAEAESEKNRNVFSPFNESELTTDKLENSNEFALLKGENVTLHCLPADENPVQEPAEKSALAEAEPLCGNLVKIVPDGRRQQQGNNQLQIVGAGFDRPTGSDRLTGEVQTRKNIPPTEVVSNRRRRQRHSRNSQLEIDWTGSDRPTGSRRPAKEVPTQESILSVEEVSDRNRSRRPKSRNKQLQIVGAGFDLPTGSDRLTGEVPTQESIPPAEEVPDRRRRHRQKSRNKQLQIDWSGSDRPTGSYRPTREVPTQESSPPTEEVADRRRQHGKVQAKTDRSDSPVLNQLIARNEQLTDREEYPQGKENIITLYLADEADEDEADTKAILSTDRRRSTVKKYKNHPSSTLLLLLKKEANQAKRRRYRSAAKIYNDFKLKKLLPGKRVK